MAVPVVLPPSNRPSLRPKDPFSRLLASLRLNSHPKASLERVDVPSPTVNANRSETFPTEIDQSLPVGPGALCEHPVDLVRHLRSLLPSSCEWLEQGTLDVVGEHPVDAGAVAEVWVGKMGDRKVAIKVYRCYSSSNCSATYVRLCNEALACSRLKDGNIAPFIGVYSSTEYPLALVSELMDNLNLREYLRNNEDAGRRKLLLEIAGGLEYMHKLDVVHGNLKIRNILVDVGGHARLAGLGVACLPPATPTVDVDRFFHGAAPELVDPRRFGLTDTGATKDSDMYAFGVLTWEVFAGRVPFSEEGGVAGVYSMLNGRRPPRPDHPELSDRVWEMIKGCWENLPSRRRTITEVIAVLDAELDRE